MQLQGNYLPKWQPVIDQFLQNQTNGDDGAGMALVVDGQVVINIAAGAGRNRQGERDDIRWTPDTLVNVFSASKGVVAICVLQLVQQGQLQLDEKLSYYWPDFARAETESIRVIDILCHRSGLSAFHPVISQEEIFDWSSIIERIAAETPWWTVNEGQGYSPFLYGWLLGELVRRVAGVESFNTYVQKNVCQPMGVEYFFGIPNEKQSLVVDTFPLKKLLEASSNSEADSAALGRIMKADPRGVTNRAFSNPISLMTSTNSIAWREAQIPAANGHTNALALAKIYGDLVSVSPQLLNKNILPLCWQEQTFEMDKVLGLPLRFSCGFMLSQPQRDDCRFGIGKKSFGHPGAGGSLGFADPDYRLGFGYVTQRMGQRILIDDRAVKLINAIYSLLGA